MVQKETPNQSSAKPGRAGFTRVVVVQDPSGGPLAS